MSLIITGASGYIGRHMLALGGPAGAVWTGRRALSLPGYRRVDSYTGKDFLDLAAGCGAVIHLAALARDCRDEALDRANVRLPLDILAAVRGASPGVRFVYVSSDLAAYPETPYGRSKRAAEEALLTAGGDVVCVRPSMVAGPPLDGLECSLGRMKKMADKKTVPLIGAGRFPIRPLWVDDLARILYAFAARAGQDSDRGVWSALGEPVGYRAAIEAMAGGRSPLVVPVPTALLALAGKVLRAVNPGTSFPTDFIAAVRLGERPQPEDAFAHLGLARTPADAIIAAC